MSFSDEDIADELQSAGALGKEWFDARGYGFRRMGKLRNEDIDELAARLRTRRKWQKLKADEARLMVHRAWKAAWMREWRRRHPDDARRVERKKYERLKKSPERYREARERDRAALRRRRANATPEQQEKRRKQARDYYLPREGLAPAELERQRALDRAGYHRRKAMSALAGRP